VKKRRGTPVKRVKQPLRYGGGSSVGLSYDPRSEPVNHLEVPEKMRLERRPTRDEREEEPMLLRTADGRVMATVERVDPSSLPN
jgi:hypothetical protein